MKLRAFFVAHTQSSELIQPREGPFHHPAPSPQPAAVFGITHGEQGQDAALPQTSTDCLRIITAIAQHAIGTVARPPMLSLQGRNGVNQFESLLRVIPVGAGELDSQWNASSVANQMTLAA